MNRSFHIRRTTAILTLVIAVLVGALIATYATAHNPGYTVATAHAASATDQIALGTFAPVVKRAMPAVVNISSSRVVKSQQQMPGGFFEDPFFRQFFGNRMPQQQRPRTERSQSLGSGVIVTTDGYILTNNHVVEGATDVKVSFGDKREFPAKIVGTDKPTDVAVIKIDQKDLPTLSLSSTVPQVGDLALAIGDPFGVGQTVTMGIVSATGRSLNGAIEQYENFIQTDAAINPGNSGGALINTHGELIGINTAILAGNSGGNQGIGFAIPVNMARSIMDQIIKSGKVSRGYIGVTLQAVDNDLARKLGLPEGARGIALTSVEPDSPGAKAGLQEGDVITAINGQPVDDVGALRVQVAGTAPGSQVHLKVVRDGNTRDVNVTLAELPKRALRGNTDTDEESDQPGVSGSGEKGAMKGVSVQTLNDELRQQLQLPANAKGVAITDLDADSPASAAGLQQGDVIEQVNRRRVSNVKEFNDAVKAGGQGSTLLLVRRGAGTQFVVVQNK